MRFKVQASRFKLIGGLFLFLTLNRAEGGELEELKKDLTIVQIKIAEEEARYQAAKAQMERSQVIAQYMFPELRLREKQLAEKIEKLIAEAEKAKNDKK